VAKKTLGKYAFGYCDRTGFRYPLHDLIEEFQQGKPTGLYVGRDVYDAEQPQDWLGKLHIEQDAQQLSNPRPDLGQDESRRMFSFDPVGVGNMAMTGVIGTVVVT